MKKLTSLFLVALASSAFAGPVSYDSKDSKGTPPPPPPALCFNAGLAVGIYGAAALPTNKSYRDNGLGGGGLIEYFFNPWIGIQTSYTATGPEPVHHEYAGELVVRFPVEGGFCFAPYILVGGGGIADSVNFGFWNAGAGIEFRCSPHTGIFADGTYNWASQSYRDFTMVRLGVKYAF